MEGGGDVLPTIDCIGKTLPTSAREAKCVDECV